MVAAADRLEGLLESADGFCREGLMLTMPRTPEMLRFSAWWVAEVRRQVAGHAPTPWGDA